MNWNLLYLFSFRVDFFTNHCQLVEPDRSTYVIQYHGSGVLPSVAWRKSGTTTTAESKVPSHLELELSSSSAHFVIILIIFLIPPATFADCHRCTMLYLHGEVQKKIVSIFQGKILNSTRVQGETSASARCFSPSSTIETTQTHHRPMRYENEMNGN